MTSWVIFWLCMVYDAISMLEMQCQCHLRLCFPPVLYKLNICLRSISQSNILLLEEPSLLPPTFEHLLDKKRNQIISANRGKGPTEFQRWPFLPITLLDRDAGVWDAGSQNWSMYIDGRLVCPVLKLSYILSSSVRFLHRCVYMCHLYT